MPRRHRRGTNSGGSDGRKSISQADKALADTRRDLVSQVDSAFRQFGQAVFQDGALPRKTKQLIAMVAAHVTQYPYCIPGHARAAVREGAAPEEIMEVIWIAAEMRAGDAFAHSTIALHTLDGYTPAQRMSDLSNE